jgi:methyltransferase (TIGR00027 family)
MDVDRSPHDPPVRNISDTALWVAHYRAVESERPDAHFRDPYARALAGERGARIAQSPQFGDRNAWAFVARTILIDGMIADAIRGGVDLVVNLAAGLDTRPYRMEVPPALRWVEVDLPDILDYKERVLDGAGAVPRCALERVRLDLSDEPARRALFTRLSSDAHDALIVSEGLLIYLSPAQVASLARDLAAPPSFRRWVIDLSSPGLMKMLARQTGRAIVEAGAPFRFAPPEGPDFFPPLGGLLSAARLDAAARRVAAQGRAHAEPPAVVPASDGGAAGTEAAESRSAMVGDRGAAQSVTLVSLQRSAT